jgi:hypothetical protein
MAPVRFKPKYSGLTFRAPFQDLPNWSDLSAKVNELCKLPLKNIAVTFTDINDSDEIAVSSDAGLQDFYQSSYRGGDIIFNVLDLSLFRTEHSVMPGEFTQSSIPSSLHWLNSPGSPERPPKRVRLEVPQTPINRNKAAPTTVDALFFSFHQAFCAYFSIVSPPRLSCQEFEASMTTALQPFVQYLTDLAEGKFDGYFDSVEPRSLATKSDVMPPNRPILLLHSLGNNKNDPRLARLFRSDTVFVSF